MNKPEILKSQETVFASLEKFQVAPGSITKAEVEEIYNSRKSRLQQIRSSICLKFYHDISEKLEKEKRLFEQLLHWEDNKQEALSHYSFVLNPYYFEQKFLGSEI